MNTHTHTHTHTHIYIYIYIFINTYRHTDTHTYSYILREREREQYRMTEESRTHDIMNLNRPPLSPSSPICPYCLTLQQGMKKG